MDDVKLPSKTTLDEIERMGVDFMNGYTAIKNLLVQNLAMARRYIVVAEEFDENGIRTAYTFHTNMSLYSEAERVNILAYYDFLKESYEKIASIENMNDLLIYDIMNIRPKLDYLISLTMATILKG